MLTTNEVRHTVVCVLEGERATRADISITFLSSQQMRALNRRTFSRDRATDVIAFPLRHEQHVVGDVYVCPSVARRSATDGQITRREEETRLVVHGVLHALGYDHPRGPRRVASDMWHRQERYVRRLGERRRGLMSPRSVAPQGA